MEWSIQRTTRFDNRYKKLAKKHRNECQNTFTNLYRYFQGLREGGKPAQLSVHSFVHNEGEGTYALDQSGELKTTTAIRLYIFPDEMTKVLRLVTIGEKNTQSRDVNEVHQFVRAIKSGLRGADNEEEATA